MMIKPFNSPIFVTRPIVPEFDDVIEKFKMIWGSQWFSNGGTQHIELEKRLTKFLGVENLSLFNNGTIALMVAAQGLRLQGEVITTPFSFPATTHVLSWNKLTPVFCDIDPKSMNIDADKIESLITDKTTAILGVHVYGTPCDVEKIKRIADRHGLRVIYDAAHAFGVEIDGRGIGTFGDVSMFSFHPTKLFHTAEGGALTCNNSNLKERFDLLKNFGIKNEFEVILPGLNGKMNELSSALGLVVLDMVNDERVRRKAIRQLYIKHLEDISEIEFSLEQELVTSSEQYLVVRVRSTLPSKGRDQLYDFLKSYNVLSRKYFYPLISEYPCYHNLPSSKGENLKNALQAANEVLCLPFYGQLKDEEIIIICEMIKEFFTH